MSAPNALDARQWEAAASELFVPLRCSTPDPTFAARSRTARLGEGLTLTRVRTGPLTVHRTPRLARESATTDVLVNLHLGSTGRVGQHGRVAVAQPGTAVMYELNHPYVLDHSTGTQDLLVLRLPRAFLSVPPARVSALCGRTVPASAPSMSATGAYLRSLHREATEQTAFDGAGLAAVLGELVGSLFRGIERTTDSPGTATLCRRMQRFLLANLHDPRTTVGALAEQFHVSVRQVHVVFAASGETPGAFLRRARLRRAATLLDGRGDEPGAVSAVARSVGYEELSSFTRAFRREFGVPPSGHASRRP